MIRNERGIALIITLLVVALLAITVVEFSYSVEIDQRMARNAMNGLQATLLARSGINLGEALLLHDDAQTQPQIDAFTEDWCPAAGPDAQSCLIDETNSQIVLPENMRLRVQIFDEGSKLNVNLTRPANNSANWQAWQQRHNNPTADVVTAFERLCDTRGVDSQQLTDALLTYWRNAIDAAEQEAGASTAGTTGPTSPGSAPAVPVPRPNPQALNSQILQILLQYEFKSLDDLGVIPGFTPDVINKLRPVLSASPFKQGPNINTAPRQVLDAIFGAPDASDEIISQRQNGPITQMPPPTGNQQARVMGLNTTFTSQFFLIRASAIINPDPLTGRGGIRRSASMLVQRFRVAPGQAGVGTTGASGWHWSLRRYDWQKEGGAALFDPPKAGEPGADDTTNSMVQG